MDWIDVMEIVPPIDDRFVGWHETEGVVVCGAYTGGGWCDDDIRAHMRLNRITHWMVIISPEG